MDDFHLFADDASEFGLQWWDSAKPIGSSYSSRTLILCFNFGLKPWFGDTLAKAAKTSLGCGFLGAAN